MNVEELFETEFPAELSPKGRVLAGFDHNRLLAHQFFFEHRHPNQTPLFHCDIIDAWHSDHPRQGVMAFREGGKSTIAEEAFVLCAGFRWFRNAIILGSTLDRACDRLRAIKHEIENNERFTGFFGELKGDVWNEAKIILSNGIIIQAFGRGQSLRGVKHLDTRPDFCFADDIEEAEHVATPEARRETLAWFVSVVIPALDKNARIRVNATPLGRDALPLTLMRQPNWLWKTYPIKYVDAKTGEWKATWDARYPLAWIDAKEKEMLALGLHDEFQREYMCQAEDPKRKLFTSSMFTVKPTVHTWQPTFAMIDPARTTKETSAMTGWAVWSWIANRLIVWEGDGALLKPDEIVAKLFEIDDNYRPVVIGVERDGLEEFLLQPIRHEQLRRNVFIPVRAVRAPKGKISFIEGLQPHFASGEASLAKAMPELLSQFASFPSGRIDIPNALAYAKHRDMFPGLVIYDNFTSSCVQEDVPVRKRDKKWLALNADGSVVTGVLVQLINGVLYVLEDYVREGDPGAVVKDIVVQSAVDAGEAPTLVAGPAHFTDYNPIGLRGAVAKIPAELQSGPAASVGRDEIRALLSRTVNDRPALVASTRARWVINALSAGYARALDKNGMLMDEARLGVYRTLMEGLETFAGRMRVGMLEAPVNIRVTEGGVPYVSALPNRSPALPSKADFLRGADVVNDLPTLMPRRR